MATRTNSSRDQNFEPTLVAVDSTDVTKTVALEADPTTGALLVSSSGGGGGADVQYTDGATTVTHPIGTIPVYDKSGTITAVSVANPLPVSASLTPPTDIFPATQNITAQDTATSTVAGFQGQSFIIGTPTAASAATFAINSITSINIQTTGIWTGSLRVEASTDGGTTYVSKFSRLPGTVYAGAATVTSNAFLIAAVSGCTHIRVRSIAAWTGTAIIKISESVNDHLTDVLNPIRLLDSTTNTLMTIKPASTAVVATDTSIAVGLSPNSPLPAGTNAVGSVSVSNFPVTQPVSVAGTLPVNMTQLNGSATATVATGVQAVGISDGTNSVNILKSDGTAAGNNSELISGTGLSVPFTTTSVSMVATTDALNYSWVSIYVASQGTSSTINFQTSNDNTNWVSLALTLSTTTATIAQSTNVSNVLYQGPVVGRYFRLNVTGISAGTTAGTVVFSTLPKVVPVPSTNSFQSGTWTVAATESGTWTVQPGNTANTTPWLIRQKSTTSTLTNVSTSTTSATVLASNAARIGAQIYNDATTVLYVKFGATASATSFTVPLNAATYYEVPAGYTGQIDGVLASGTGTARCTEET